MKAGESEVEYVGDGSSNPSFSPRTGVLNGSESLLPEVFGVSARAAALSKLLFWAVLVEKESRGACTIVASEKMEGPRSSRARTGTRLGATDMARPRCAMSRCLVPTEEDELGGIGGNGASVFFSRVVMSEI
jgi:hypothetical protein